MSIGALVPGQPTTVTPDANPAYYSSFEGPAPDDLIIADHILAVIQLALNVQARASEHVGSPYSVMQAVTNAVSGTWYHVLGQGWYVYSPTTRTDNGPWYYSAPGMQNVGSWVHELFLIMVTNNPTTKLIDAILPYMQTLFDFYHTTTSNVLFTLTNQTDWIQITDSSGTPEELRDWVAADTLANDRLHLNLTPYRVTLGSGDSVSMRVRITQNSVSTYYTLPLVETSGVPLVAPQIHYLSNGEEPIEAALEARNTAGHTSIIRSTDPSAGGWGDSAAYEWCTGALLRLFAGTGP